MTRQEQPPQDLITWYAQEHRKIELALHPQITTTEEKIEFVKESLKGVSYDELAEALPSGENGSIDQDLLDTTFAFASFLERMLIAEAFPGVLRNRAPVWGNKTFVEMLQEGQAESLLGHYAEAFDFSHTG